MIKTVLFLFLFFTPYSSFLSFISFSLLFAFLLPLLVIVNLSFTSSYISLFHSLLVIFYLHIFLSPLYLSSISFSYRISLFHVLLYLYIPFSFSYLLSLFHIFMSLFSFLFFVLFSCNSLSLSMNNLSPLLCLPSLSLRLY